VVNDLYTPGKVRTFSGLFVDPLNLQPDDINIMDIAHALSQIPRFGGHSRVQLSVAQHCCWVMKELPDELKLFGLLHDASEAYLLDIPSPLKERLPGYKEAEAQAMANIALAFGLPIGFHEHPEVKAVDKRALQYEWRNYVKGFRSAKKNNSAKQDFLFEFKELWAKRPTFSAV
jgi:5'-deoxynucleotidase YfbR-like HD superfamily hydrolase